jgi:hypothetical protein
LAERFNQVVKAVGRDLIQIKSPNGVGPAAQPRCSTLDADVRNAFELLGRSGTVRRGSVFPEGGCKGGWRHREHTGQPTHVPPGGTGRVRVWAVAEPVTIRDDPAALTFRGVRIDFR